MISLIAAMAQNRVIGINNQLPWHLSADLKNFKSLTLGKPILMGRNTYESIGRPLPQRLNVVLTKDKNFRASGITVAHSIDDALDIVCEAEEIMIIGGATLYEQLFPKADKIYLTIIHQDFCGDAKFPKLDSEMWLEAHRTDFSKDSNTSFDYSFVEYERNK